MKYLFRLFFVVFTLPLFCCGQAKNDTLFYESFNSTLLDRSKWNVEVTGHTVNNEQQAYIDSNLVLKLQDGSLQIKPVFKPGYISDQKNSYDFLSGRINSSKKFEFTYGTASARIKMSAGAGLWPAFWAKGEGKWPDCGEIDVMENVGDPSWVSSAMHGPGYSGNTPISHHYVFPKGMDITQWHIYSVTWTANSMTFKIDGTTTYALTKADIEKYGRWAYDNPKFLIINFALGGNYPKGVNKVTAPYPGLPESTVQQIKDGKTTFWVDWVLVTRE